MKFSDISDTLVRYLLQSDGRLSYMKRKQRDYWANQRIILLILGAFLSFSAQASTSTILPAPSSTSMQGVALLVHGLNLNPERLLTLGRGVQSAGYTVVLPALSGHDMSLTDKERIAAFAHVSAEQWLDEFEQAYRQAQHIAQTRNRPLVLVAYSLGALVAQVAAQQRQLLFDRQVLLAPAIQLRGHTALIRPLQGWPGLVLPSLSPGYYRANAGTPMAAYRSLFTLIGQLNSPPQSGSFSKVAQMPTLVLLSEDDEFVDGSGTVAWMAAMEMTRWQVCTLRKSDDADTAFHHLMIDDRTLGQSAWRAVGRQVVQFLVNEKGCDAASTPWITRINSERVR